MVLWYPVEILYYVCGVMPPVIHSSRIKAVLLTALSAVFPERMALALALVRGKYFRYASYRCRERALRSAASGCMCSMSDENSASSFSFSACGIRPKRMAGKGNRQTQVSRQIQYIRAHAETYYTHTFLYTYTFPWYTKKRVQPILYIYFFNKCRVKTQNSYQSQFGSKRALRPKQSVTIFHEACLIK